MDRTAFESLIEAVLADTLSAAKEGGASRLASKQLSAIQYGEAEAEIGNSVSKLTASRSVTSPIAPPSSDYLPPCF